MKFVSLAAAAASAGLAVALPLEISVLGGATFRVAQSYNQNINPIGRGPRALAKAYQKYGVQMDDDLITLLEAIAQQMGFTTPLFNSNTKGNSSSSRGNTPPVKANSSIAAGQGSVAATPQLFDIEYLAPVQIGSPPQTLMLNFDTGSSDLWVFTNETPKTQATNHTVYDISKSTTAKRLGNSTWSIRYGDNSSSSGLVYTDTVTIGGLSVPVQAVESATKVSGQFTRDTASSGLVGLAFDNINTVVPVSQKTFFSNSLGLLAMPLFSANLKNQQESNYNFGFIDKTEFVGELSFVDVNSTSGFWEFAANGFSVNGKAQDFPHRAIADTGTTLLMLPTTIATAYYLQVPGAKIDRTQGGYVFDCKAKLPDLTLIVGTYKAVVPGKLINYAPIDDTGVVCFGGIQDGGSFNFAIYGDIFLKAQFTVFHGGAAQLGFAAKPE